MDISCADISSLPLSVGPAGDMPQPDSQPRLSDYESAMGGMTLIRLRVQQEQESQMSKKCRRIRRLKQKETRSIKSEVRSLTQM